jgi:hypothetical protein
MKLCSVQFGRLMLDFERKIKWYAVYLLSAALHEVVVGIQGAPLNCISGLFISNLWYFDMEQKTRASLCCSILMLLSFPRACPLSAIPAFVMTTCLASATLCLQVQTNISPFLGCKP